MSKPPNWRRLWHRKPLDAILVAAATAHYERTLKWTDLTLLALGSIIGAGVFVLTGQAAAEYAGPAIVVSFVIAGVVAAFSALCYAELSGLIPLSGSAFTYTYASLGELAAWSVGWTMILEYIVASATVAVSFSGYLDAFLLAAFNAEIPKSITTPPLIFDPETASFIVTGAFFDLPAVVLLLSLTAILVIGIRESATFNAVSVGVKLVVILIFIFAGIGFITPSNWSPFVPLSEGGEKYGAWGVIRGASVVFFAYIGFDSVCTVAQETINPAVSLPLSILLSLTISTILYIIVALVLTGLVPYTELAGDHPIAVGIRATGITWLEPLVDFGALCGLASTCLGGLMGISRVVGTIAADGMLPALLSRLHPRFKTPWIPTIAAGILSSIMAALLPISVLASLTSAGTLLAFLAVCAAVPIMRHLEPDRERLFKVPGGPIIPVLGGTSALALLTFAGWPTFVRLLAWLIAGWIFYFWYAFRRDEPGDDIEMTSPTRTDGPAARTDGPPTPSRVRRKKRTEGGEPLLHTDSGDETDSSTSSSRKAMGHGGVIGRVASRTGTRGESVNGV